jgi:hypothetical protein
MSTWSELIDAGYSRVFGVLVEGIPYAFLETRLMTTADDDIAVPADYTAARGALRVRESDSISKELDRITGLGRGRALDLVLALDVLGDIGAELFRTPSLRARLTADADGTATTFNVDDTTGFSGFFYVGREFCTYAGSTATSFTGVTRAIAGWAHYHPSSTASGYRFCTDRPQYWRGRFVTVFEHLVGADGRALASTACEVGTYCRELWKGYIDAQPQVDGRQMLLRCLPIERLLAQKLGGTAKGDVVYQPVEGLVGTIASQFGRFPVVLTESDLFYVENLETGDTATIGSGVTSPTIATVDQVALWVSSQVQNRFATEWIAGTWRVVVNENGFPTIQIRVALEDSGTRQQVIITPRCWFLQAQSPSTYQDWIAVSLISTRRITGDEFGFVVAPNVAANPWVIVKPDLENDGEPATWPASGFLLLENDEGLEVAAFDSQFADPTGQLRAVRLSARALMGTERINPFLAGTRITVVPGMRGTLSEVMQTLGTSSGTGLRGVFDTLGYGLGLAIPGDWFDVNGYPVASQYVDGASDDAASVENIVGGWLALMGRCLTQRQNAAGYVRLVAPSTSLDVPGTALTVLPSDVLVGATKTERLFESPNVVRIEDSLRQGRTVSVIRDVPRQQAEGARTVTFIAPGINTASALAYGGKMLALSDGQLVITLGVRSGLALGVGDPCRLDLDHPAIWSWSDGAVASSVPARVIGESENLGTGERSLTFLVPGQQQTARQLCPAARVDGYLSTTVLEVDDVTGFAAGMELYIYRRGDATVSTTRTVAAVDTTLDTIELTTPLLAVTYPADGDTWLTYADFGTGTAEQDEHLFMNRGSFEA